jgi:uncharacterized Ntn-hydrolase superfamily protein
VTFSIVGYDPGAGAWGVAVASCYLAVGGIVPAAGADAGALATQARTNAGWKAAGLAALRDGTAAEDVVAGLVKADPGRDERQVGVVDRAGHAATWTGPACLPWAGGYAAPGVAIQGNILTGPEVVDAMRAAWGDGDGPLAERLLAALAAGDAAGGDSRGRQAAGLLVVRRAADHLVGSDVDVDLRADDTPDPVGELGRLLRLRRAGS